MTPALALALVALSLLALLASLPPTSAQQAATPTASSYAPTYIPCPPASSTPLVRLAGTPAQNNQTLAAGEAAFRDGRAKAIAPLWEAYVSDATAGKGTGYDVASLTAGNNPWPVVGLAHSGGGFRAALYAASVVQALDGRNATSPLAGVLQLLTYQTGLSGGSWFLSSLILNGYPTIPALTLGNSPNWELSKDLLTPDGILGVSDNRGYYDALFADLAEKSEAGFNTSITDIWGRALAYHLLPGTTNDNFYTSQGGTAHGAGILFSQIASLPIYLNASLPFPLLVANNHPPSGQKSGAASTTVIPLDTTVYEISPLEMGSYDPYLAAFTPTALLGTYAEAGNAFVPAFVNRTAQAAAAGNCVSGFDQASFIYGTSSSLFNAITTEVNQSISATASEVIETLLKTLSGRTRATAVDVANYPNPFQGVNGPSGFDRANDIALEVVDGGENGENVPLGPLLVKARGVDVIIAADASADTSEGDVPNGGSWPNGTSLVTTYNRTYGVLPNGTREFPEVPLQQTTWVYNGYNRRPTFFGCNDTAPVPLVIYLPNSPEAQAGGYTANTSTFQLGYSDADVQSFLDAGTASANAGIVSNGQADGQWPTCLACALLDRTRARANVARSTACVACMRRYCYNGTTYDGRISTNGAAPSDSGAGGVLVRKGGVVVAVIVAVVVVGLVA